MQMGDGMHTYPWFEGNVGVRQVLDLRKRCELRRNPVALTCDEIMAMEGSRKPQWPPTDTKASLEIIATSPHARQGLP